MIAAFCQYKISLNKYLIHKIYICKLILLVSIVILNNTQYNEYLLHNISNILFSFQG